MPSQHDAYAVRQQCTRFLSGPKPRTPQQVLQELAETTPADLRADRYGGGALLEGFEAEVASLLGKEAAVFMPSGTMAQQIVLRLWAERTGTTTIGLHPRSHLEEKEQQAYQRLSGLQGVKLGDTDRLMTQADLAAVHEPLAALTLELPLRELGCQLPTWEELVGLCGLARERRIPLHMDGARVWESQPYYDRPLAEIAGLFDTVYVSFYKGLGGIAGCAVAGSKAMMDAARVWQKRQGGVIVQQYPMVLAAQRGLAANLPRMAEFHQRAKEIAVALSDIPGVYATPNPPHTNTIHVAVAGVGRPLTEVAVEISAETGVWLFQWTVPCHFQGIQVFELVVHSATTELEVAEIKELVKRLVNDNRAV